MSSLIEVWHFINTLCLLQYLIHSTNILDNVLKWGHKDEQKLAESPPTNVSTRTIQQALRVFENHNIEAFNPEWSSQGKFSREEPWTELRRTPGLARSCEEEECYAHFIFEKEVNQ